MNQSQKTERKRKHISIKIDQKLGCELLWVQRDKETGSDLYQLVVFFPSLLWKKFRHGLPQTSLQEDR